MLFALNYINLSYVQLPAGSFFLFNQAAYCLGNVLVLN